jgi:hypothetical protein
MEPSIDSLLTWPTLLLSIGIYVVVRVIRRIVEGGLFRHRLRDKFYWREVIVPIFPVVVGAIWGAVHTNFPYPEGLNGRGSHALYGLVCGFFSGLVYRIITSVVGKRWPTEQKPGSESSVIGGSGAPPPLL